VTRRSIAEYAEALRKRYFRASREEKGRILDEFTQVTGLHRKAAIQRKVDTIYLVGYNFLNLIK